MKVMIVISSLGAGGAERIVSIISNFWARRGWQIGILTFDGAGAKSFYELNSSVSQYHLGFTKSRTSIPGKIVGNLQRVYELRKKIKAIKPDVVISFLDQTNVLTLLAAAFTSTPVIVTEHVNPNYYSPGKVWNILRKIFYPYAHSLIAVSRGVLDYFPDKIRKKGFVIPNPVDIRAVGKKGNDARGRKIVMGIGRFTHEKGFDLLIKAFSELKDKHNCWDLEIWGEGPNRRGLEALRDGLGLQKRVRLPGLTKNSFRELKRADVFVLSSRFEGFGIVLCEAMACGAPVISFNCPNGPGEIIQSGIDGILVPPEDTKALSEAMDDLMTDETLRNKLAARAVTSVERFGTDNIMGLWEELFKNLFS